MALFATIAMPSRGQDLLDFRQVILCKSLRDNAARLQCFDRAVSDAPTEHTRNSNIVEVESDWQITESRSPADDLPRIAAVLQAVEGTAALVLRCNDRVTEVYINLRTYVGGVEPLPIAYRFNDGADDRSALDPLARGRRHILGNANSCDCICPHASRRRDVLRQSARLPEPIDRSDVQAWTGVRRPQQSRVGMPMAGATRNVGRASHAAPAASFGTCSSSETPAHPGAAAALEYQRAALTAGRRCPRQRRDLSRAGFGNCH